MRAILRLLVVAVAACSSGLTTVPSTTVPATEVAQTIPAISPEVAAELRARAFVIGCERFACEGQPIFASNIIPQEVRVRIGNLLASAVSYLTDQEASEISGPAGIHAGLGAWIGVESVEETVRPDVVSVMTYVDGPGRNMGTETLFQWNGEEWVHVAADEVGLTVITAVP